MRKHNESYFVAVDNAKQERSDADERKTKHRNLKVATITLLLCGSAALACCSFAQEQQTAPANNPPEVRMEQPPSPEGAPVVVTLKDAIDRARKIDATYFTALAATKSAHEDRLQARNAMLPSVSDLSAYLNTQGTGVLGPNGVPEGRFVTNDGVHVYRQWAVLHQDLSPNTYLANGLHRTAAAEAIAKAKEEISRRGLTVTVTKLYYGLVSAQRKYATAQQSQDQAKRFFDLAQQEERSGQVSHSDVIKSEIQYRQQEQFFEEARLAMDSARLDLAVVLFPTLTENYSVVDDMDTAQPLPGFAEMQALAGKQNPDLRVATETVRQSNIDVTAAKAAFLPSLSLDVDYGIEANQFALNTVWATHPEAGPVPALGYFLTAQMTFPVWDWGTLRSKVHQAELTRDVARISLTQTQRQLLAELYSSYNEASVAREAMDSSRRTADLAAESLRLTTLRYQAGESNALEVVDAQNTLILARNGYSDAEVRYRVALATLQTLTGNF